MLNIDHYLVNTLTDLETSELSTLVVFKQGFKELGAQQCHLHTRLYIKSNFGSSSISRLCHMDALPLLHFGGNCAEHLFDIFNSLVEDFVEHLIISSSFFY